MIVPVGKNFSTTLPAKSLCFTEKSEPTWILPNCPSLTTTLGLDIISPRFSFSRNLKAAVASPKKFPSSKLPSPVKLKFFSCVVVPVVDSNRCCSGV